MALTRSDWALRTIQRGESKFLIATCTVAQTTAEKQAFTKAITFLDPVRPFKIHCNTTNATLDNATLPVDVLGSPYLASDGITLNGSVASMDALESSGSTVITTNGASTGTVVGGIIKGSLIADVKAGVGIVEYKQDSTASHVMMPTIWLNLDGASTLAAETCHWMITQEIMEQNVAYR